MDFSLAAYYAACGRTAQILRREEREAEEKARRELKKYEGPNILDQLSPEALSRIHKISNTCSYSWEDD